MLSFYHSNTQNRKPAKACGFVVCMMEMKDNAVHSIPFAAVSLFYAFKAISAAAASVSATGTPAVSSVWRL